MPEGEGEGGEKGGVSMDTESTTNNSTWNDHEALARLPVRGMMVSEYVRLAVLTICVYDAGAIPSFRRVRELKLIETNKVLTMHKEARGSLVLLGLRHT